MQPFASLAKRSLLIFASSLLIACSPPATKKDNPDKQENRAVSVTLTDDTGTSGFKVVNPWIRPAASTSKTTAGYMTLKNIGKKDDTLISVRSDIAGFTELHQSMEMDGANVMRQVADLTIPAGGEIVMAPGGYHLMFINLNRTVSEGEEATVIFTFEQYGDVEINVPVHGDDGDQMEMHETGHEGH